MADNSLGRLLALSDGVFAIAMTLLTLGLHVPEIGAHPSDAHLRHALAANSSAYWSFVVSFYVVAAYWLRHRRLMKSVVNIHPSVVRETLLLLLVVSTMPFFANLLGNYGREPFAVALYAAANIVAVLILIVLGRDIRRLDLVDAGAGVADDVRSWHAWSHLGVLVLCVPTAYLLGRHADAALALLVLPGLLSAVRRGALRRRTPTDRVIPRVDPVKPSTAADLHPTADVQSRPRA